VICDRCGRNNPENLAFCQDCGRRLASQAGIVPPTPPTGLGVIPQPVSNERGSQDVATRGSAIQLRAPFARRGGPFARLQRATPSATASVCVRSRLPPVNASAHPNGGDAPVSRAPTQALAICPRASSATAATAPSDEHALPPVLWSSLRAKPSAPAPAANGGCRRSPFAPDGLAPRPSGGGSSPQRAQRGRGEPAGRLVTIAATWGRSLSLAGRSTSAVRRGDLLREDAYVSEAPRLIRREHGWYAKTWGRSTASTSGSACPRPSRRRFALGRPSSAKV
jgi:hypothetical protein